ncbi:hypothetical protein KAU34_03100, partial [candidate division WOR-3 bacterium]|nr:hypothetical protein [candidate division WOR-3 bacterium]
ARVLRISRTTLYQKIKKYGLDSYRDEVNKSVNINY